MLPDGLHPWYIELVEFLIKWGFLLVTIVAPAILSYVRRWLP